MKKNDVSLRKFGLSLHFVGSTQIKITISNSQLVAIAKKNECLEEKNV